MNAYQTLAAHDVAADVALIVAPLGFEPECGGGGCTFLARYGKGGESHVWATCLDGGGLPTASDWQVCAYPGGDISERTLTNFRSDDGGGLTLCEALARSIHAADGFDEATRGLPAGYRIEPGDDAGAFRWLDSFGANGQPMTCGDWFPTIAEAVADLRRFVAGIEAEQAAARATYPAADDLDGMDEAPLCEAAAAFCAAEALEHWSADEMLMRDDLTPHQRAWLSAFLLAWEAMERRREASGLADKLVERLGGGFHPDTRGDEYVEFDTGAATFTAEEAAQYDRDVARLFDLAADPYDVAVKAMERAGLTEPMDEEHPDAEALPPFRIAFPEYPAEMMPAAPDGFVDASWRNEACPCYRDEGAGLVIWCDFPDDASREHPGDKRFLLQQERDDDAAPGGFPVTVCASDDWRDILTAIDAVRAVATPRQPFAGSVLDHWARVLPGSLPADDAATLASMPADSGCGRHCVALIDAAGIVRAGMFNAMQDGPMLGRCLSGLIDGTLAGVRVAIAG